MSTEHPPPSGHSEAQAKASTNSVGELIRTLRDDLIALFRQEIALARTEASEKAGKLGRQLVHLAVAGIVAFLAAWFLVLAIESGLELILLAVGVTPVVTIWLSPLIVGLVLGAVAYALITKATSTLKHETPFPFKTKQSLEEDKQWLHQKTTHHA